MELVGAAQPVGFLDLGGLRLVVGEPRRLGGRPHDGFQDGLPGLRHGDPDRFRAPAAMGNHDREVDGREASHREVMAGEGDGPSDPRLGAGRAQRDRGDVAAIRAPDLPVR